MTLSPMTLLSDKVQGPSQVSPVGLTFLIGLCSLLLYMDELERGCLFCRNTLVGVTTIGDRDN